MASGMAQRRQRNVKTSAAAKYQQWQRNRTAYHDSMACQITRQYHQWRNNLNDAKNKQQYPMASA